MNDSGEWKRDPTGRHDHRFWDGRGWTEHVADGGVQGVEPYETAVARAIGTAAALLETDEITMPFQFFGFSLPLYDSRGRRIGQAVNGHVRAADRTLVVRPSQKLTRLGLVLDGNRSPIGTIVSPTRVNRRGRVKQRSIPYTTACQFRLDGSDDIVADVSDGHVTLAGDGRREIATIEKTARHVGGNSWKLTFSSCDDDRLRLMCLRLFASLVSRGGA